MRRRGIGLGKGSGWKNLIRTDPRRHGLSAKGIKTSPNVLLSNPEYRNLDDDLYLLTLFDYFVKQGGSGFLVLQPDWKGSKVWTDRDNRVIIKDRGDKRMPASFEARIMNLMARRFPYYPHAFVKHHAGRWYLITENVGSRLWTPIQKLHPDIQRKLAEAQQYLFEQGYVDFDFRGDNVHLDRYDNPIIIDFDKTFAVDKSDKNIEIQYNLNILSIFGLRDYRKAQKYMTMDIHQLGI